MVINVSTRVFNIIKQITRNGVFFFNEMRNIQAVVSYLRTVKENEVADWIDNNKIQYLTGLLEGFAVDNSQKEQLKEIHTKTAEAVFTKS